jgi:DNA-binding FadR family transcriptional regulator
MIARRALVALAKDGVLERRRGRGGGALVARRPTHGVVHEIEAYRAATVDIRRLIDHRVVLEGGIAHLAAVHAEPAPTPKLEKLVEEKDRAETRAVFHVLDEHFHKALAAMTGISMALEDLAIVLHELYRGFLRYLMECLRESNTEHKALVAAVARHDPIAAVSAMRDHVAALHRTIFVGLMNDKVTVVASSGTAAFLTDP